eukprot:9831005-Alexandrium_andersonii.AAC.1
MQRVLNAEFTHENFMEKALARENFAQEDEKDRGPIPDDIKVSVLLKGTPKDTRTVLQLSSEDRGSQCATAR